MKHTKSLVRKSRKQSRVRRSKPKRGKSRKHSRVRRSKPKREKSRKKSRVRRSKPKRGKSRKQSRVRRSKRKSRHVSKSRRVRKSRKSKKSRVRKSRRVRYRMESEISSRSETKVFRPKDRKELKAAVDDYTDNKENGIEKYGLIGSWDTSRVTDMSKLFQFTDFNENISSWNTSKVENMSYMFSEAKSFNQPLNSWNTSKVENMEGMFYEATNFNQPLNKWNVSNVKNMGDMFNFAKSFNQPLNKWNVSKVESMIAMFAVAESFNQPLNKWDVSNVKNMESMFNGATSFNQDISNWDMSSVENMRDMFTDTTSLKHDKPKLPKYPKVKLADCGNYENKDSTTLMGIPFENLNKTRKKCEAEGIDPDECGINRIVKLPDGNCEDIFTFRDRAESADRNVDKNPYTMVELDESTKRKIINQLIHEGVTELEMSDGHKKPVEQLFFVNILDKGQGEIDDWETLGSYFDRLTNRVIANRGQGVYKDENVLIGIVNDWDQQTRSLLNRDNQVILRIPEDVDIYEDYDSYGEIMFKIDGIPEGQVIIKNLTPDEEEAEEAKIMNENRQRMQQFRDSEQSARQTVGRDYEQSSSA